MISSRHDKVLKNALADVKYDMSYYSGLQLHILWYSPHNVAIKKPLSPALLSFPFSFRLLGAPSNVKLPLQTTFRAQEMATHSFLV